jgi:hypothetical protein
MPPIYYFLGSYDDSTPRFSAILTINFPPSSTFYETTISVAVGEPKQAVSRVFSNIRWGLAERRRIGPGAKQ